VADVVREQFLAVVSELGSGVVQEPKRLAGILLDRCPDHRREVLALLTAIKEHIHAELEAGRSGSSDLALVARLTRRLCDDVGFQEDLARWAVEVLAVSLGVISPSQAKTPPPAPQSRRAGTAGGPAATLAATRQLPCARCGKEFPLPPAGSTFYASCPACRTLAYIGPGSSVAPAARTSRLSGMTDSEGVTKAMGNCPDCGQPVDLTAARSTFLVKCSSCQAPIYIGP